jgi:hypothetical protein
VWAFLPNQSAGIPFICMILCRFGFKKMLLCHPSGCNFFRVLFYSQTLGFLPRFNPAAAAAALLLWFSVRLEKNCWASSCLQLCASTPSYCSCCFSDRVLILLPLLALPSPNVLCMCNPPKYFRSPFSFSLCVPTMHVPSRLLPHPHEEGYFKSS